MSLRVLGGRERKTVLQNANYKVVLLKEWLDVKKRDCGFSMLHPWMTLSYLPLCSATGSFLSILFLTADSCVEGRVDTALRVFT